MCSRNGHLATLTLIIIATTANANDAGQKHPLLYFGWDDVAVLQQKAATTHLKISRQITEAGAALKAKPEYYLPPETAEKFNSRWNEVYGNNLCAFAMYCLLNPTDKKAFELVSCFNCVFKHPKRVFYVFFLINKSVNFSIKIVFY